ncbi:hypothetical protein [Piscinibacter terrae]|uniref:Ribosomal protein L7/L12 C-terminal domain-containing protein n=1 Tax=Piscinibacter terrae TaxID=2496871 RepID=A0A3N7HPB7_9BURK|nr:hypothetical protein [Albitalea terrae]RQP24048.1 hypothetical protein DZC73_11970 [Albitalea terrae]
MLPMQLETALLIVIAVLLVELVRRLGSVETNVKKLLALQEPVPTGSLEPSAEVIGLARAGKEIEAMRLYRRESGADVRQAMKVVAETRSSSVA